MDARALEDRTQVIGRELFAAARREHAHLSVMNRWSAQVLSWCLADPAVKSRVLRFVDVLPSLATPRAIARHLRDYFPDTAAQLPASLRLGSSLARGGLLTAPALATVIRQLVEELAQQFIAERRPDAAAQVVQQLAQRRATCSLDLLGEHIVSDEEADAYVASSMSLLHEMAAACAALSSPPPTCGPLANLSVKPSALTPRFDPISPEDAIGRAAQRLKPLLALAEEEHALITLDMEEYALRDLTMALAQRVISQGHDMGIVVQAYLRDAEAVVEEMLRWCRAQDRRMTVRLVKGAYWDAEVAQAAQQGWPVPVYQTKPETDAAFERLTRRLLGAQPLVTTAIASHNVRSVAHAMAVVEALGLAPDAVEFQLLYGMGDALHAAIVSRGYPVRCYTPIGELIPGMAYLVRRLLENTANESFLRQDWSEERSVEELLQDPAVPAATAGSMTWRGEPFLNFAAARDRERLHQGLRTVRRQLGRSYGLLIGDRAVEAPATLTSRNPANPDEVIGTVACASRGDADRAVRIAEEAQAAWARTPATERAACLRRAAAIIRERRQELAAWEILEAGKPWREADADLVEAIEYLEYYSERMLELARGRALPQLPWEQNRYGYLPRGVALVIAPWNFPAAILTGMTAAALAAGNAVIVKPAEQSSILAAQLVRILHEAGIPPSVAQCLSGLGEEVGAFLVRHPGTRVILFTGSKAVGLFIVEAAARVLPGQRFIKHVVAEMGGKNAILVDDDADLDAVVDGVVQSAFGYAGQKCSACSRLIVHAAVADRLLARLSGAVNALRLGDPADPSTDCGPLIEAAAQRRLRDAINRAREVGDMVYQYPDARVPLRGYFVGPAIVEGIPRDDALAREELFGPLVCVFRVNSFEEGLIVANDTDYALTGGVYSRSPSHLEEAVRTFDVGNLYLNRPITGAIVGRQPFGGHRLSGLGTKAGGPDYLLQLLLPKTVCASTARHGMPLE